LELAPDHASFRFPNHWGSKLKDIVDTAKQGCRGCQILSDSIDLCLTGLDKSLDLKVATILQQPGKPPRPVFNVSGMRARGEDYQTFDLDVFTLPGMGSPQTGRPSPILDINHTIATDPWHARPVEQMEWPWVIKYCS
jgi:hypothetical protein